MKRKNSPSIVFLGTPEFALPSLAMLLEEGYHVKAVVTQPDRKKGRGHKFVAPPVKQFAEEKGIPVYQYESVSKEGLKEMQSLAPELMITAAFGQMLSTALLDVPALGCINVHGSLLPAYRGAAPIEYAILNGEKKTGITTMYTVRAMDAGDILEQDEITILPEDTAGTLREKLAELGAQTLKRTLERLGAGTLVATPQEEAKVSFAPSFPKGFGAVAFKKSSEEIINFIRGINPAPGAYAFLGEDKVKLLFAKEAAEKENEETPGKILVLDEKEGILVATGDGAIWITRLQYPGAKEMQTGDFLRGRGKFLKVGMQFESSK